MPLARPALLLINITRNFFCKNRQGQRDSEGGLYLEIFVCCPLMAQTKRGEEVQCICTRKETNL